ncbi:MAG: DUF5330 domain-containing protein [Hyphomicrobiales bacterium]|nr:DUF5330 domain-containing protein [Hyphomicrobiales bacterium]
MTLLKLLFWSFIVLLLLPSDPADKQALYTAAQATLRDIRGFCGRNPEVCQNAEGAVSKLGERAWAGFDAVQSLIADNAAEQPAQRITTDEVTDLGSLRMAVDAEGEPEPSPSQNTLTENDLEPQWTAPARRRVD